MANQNDYSSIVSDLSLLCAYSEGGSVKLFRWLAPLQTCHIIDGV